MIWSIAKYFILWKSAVSVELDVILVPNDLRYRVPWKTMKEMKPKMPSLSEKK